MTTVIDHPLQPQAVAARMAQLALAAAGGEARTDVLRQLERLLEEQEAELLAANKLDLEAAEGTQDVAISPDTPRLVFPVHVELSDLIGALATIENWERGADWLFLATGKSSGQFLRHGQQLTDSGHDDLLDQWITGGGYEKRRSR